ncbi:Aste57867_10174 [Aphanomyces stellatus]|uniref:Aste57867_10174 protein n=1 Tax=Aphanomyces stellatus TaxID=120398 RepID=A0A485KPQ2_9STRA|nr:hypothetical protein As57867_010135 [Aphanomyces stellatus]VFT87050.1 Aste57867_10174 [Aphanomyces stellatus]
MDRLPQAVLLSSELLATVVSYQHGLYITALPFLNVEIPVLHARRCPNVRFNASAFDASHSALVDWVQTWGVGYLRKLCACLPHMREVVAQDAVWFNDMALVLALHDVFGMATFASCLLDLAAQQDNLDMLRTLHTLGCRSHSTDMVAWAADHGNLPMVEYLFQRGFGVCPADLMSWSPPSRGQVSVLEYLVHKEGSNRAQISTWAMAMAAKMGWVDLLDRLHGLGAPYCNAVLRMAAMFGHFNILQWVHRRHPQERFREAVYPAAERGHLHIIQYLQEENAFLKSAGGLCCHKPTVCA